VTAPLLRVALTGGIATGKSHCLRRFAELGAPTIDADTLAKQAVEPGTDAFRAVVQRFGPAVVAANGTLDRAALGDVVFGDDEARHALEAIIHPTVRQSIDRWFESLGLQPGVRAGIADIPLLFETGRDKDFDVVVVAACAPATQKARLMNRDGLSEEQADQRIRAQMPIDDKTRRARYVISTEGTIAETDRRVAQVWSEISGAT
jgi:dephospho-CoA kinase